MASIWIANFLVGDLASQLRILKQWSLLIHIALSKMYRVYMNSDRRDVLMDYHSQHAT